MLPERVRSKRKNTAYKKAPVKIIEEKSNNPSDGSIRLQKYLSECGIASRRASEKLMQEGRVKVNGKVANKLGFKVNPAVDVVHVNGVQIKTEEKGIVLFHKPRLVVSTMSDPEGRKCLADFMTSRYRSYNPVGRLDWDSSGLIVLTNDGDLAEKLLHPRYKIDRYYHAKVEGSVGHNIVEKLKKGVRLIDGIAKAEARIMDSDDKDSWVEVCVREGRNRLVRRMMQEVGHPVVKLIRISHGPFRLGRIKSGEMKKLSEKDYRFMKRAILEEIEKKDSDIKGERRF